MQAGSGDVGRRRRGGGWLRVASVGSAGAGVGLAMAGEAPTGIALGALLFGFSRWTDRSPTRALPSGAVFGFGLALGSARWVPEAVMASGAGPIQAAVFSLLLGCWMGSLPYAAMAAGVSLAQSLPGWLRPPVVGLYVFLLESGLNGLMLDVPWTRLGHAFVWGFEPYGVLSLGGVPAVSALVAMAAAALVVSWRQAQGMRPSGARAWAVPALLVGLASVAIEAGPRPASNHSVVADRESVRVLGIQPRFPSSGRWDPDRQPIHLERIARFSRRAVEEAEPAPDLVVWPENVVTTPIDDEAIAGPLRDSIVRLGVPLLSGMQQRVPGRSDTRESRSSGIYLWNGDAILVDHAEKQLPVPGFESRPGGRLGVWLLEALLGDALAKVPVSAGREHEADEQRLVRLLCFEALFPPLAARRRSEDSIAIVVLADDSWIERPSARRQLAMFSTLRSAELGLPLMRIAHGGISLRTDARGRVVEALALNEWGALEARWPARRSERRRAAAAPGDSALRRFRSFVKGSQSRGGRRT